MQKAGLWQDHGLVFPSGIGTPLLGGNLNRAFKVTLQRAGCPKYASTIFDIRAPRSYSGRASTRSTSRNF